MSDFVIFSFAIVNLKFEIENWLANWSPIVIKLHLEYENTNLPCLSPVENRIKAVLERLYGEG